MSYYTVDELSFDLPASSVSRANGGFKEGDTDVIGRWVQKDTGNTVVLLAANNKPLGVITRVSATQVGVAIGPVVKGKKGPDAAIGIGLSVRGATRNLTGEANARGFVQAVDTTSAATAERSAGYVLDGGTVTTANEDGSLVEVKLY